jgi:hypothetical protein
MVQTQALELHSSKRSDIKYRELKTNGSKNRAVMTEVAINATGTAQSTSTTAPVTPAMSDSEPATKFGDELFRKR